MSKLRKIGGLIMSMKMIYKFYRYYFKLDPKTTPEQIENFLRSRYPDFPKGRQITTAIIRQINKSGVHIEKYIEQDERTKSARKKVLRDRGKFDKSNFIEYRISAINKMKFIFDRLGIKYSQNYPIVISKGDNYSMADRFIVDFYVYEPFKLIVECDGHTNTSNRKFDAHRANLLSDLGYGETLRISNKHILKDGFFFRDHIRRSNISKPLKDSILQYV